ncbi:MAG: AAA family ATPase [Candidatus Aenigmarchaeota archaeon]|nr:AAA family ATPase [Candidatus Aenigmarchaeota archaeon]MCX8179632.1 AAA family ATPase [Candidatus Aenigmarchaeota archaeon]
MIVIVAGLKGSGKTTVLKFVTQKRPDIKILNAGDFFAQVFQKYGLSRDQGDLGIPREKYVKIQKEIFKNLAKEVKKHKNVIIDTHLFLTKMEGYYPGLPEFAMKEINPDVIVVLEYDPKIILKRREKDLKELGRERSAAFTIEGIEWEQEIQRHFAFVSAAFTATTVKIIKRYEKEKRDFEHAEKNAEEILKLFENQ